MYSVGSGMIFGEFMYFSFGSLTTLLIVTHQSNSVRSLSLVKGILTCTDFALGSRLLQSRTLPCIFYISLAKSAKSAVSTASVGGRRKGLSPSSQKAQCFGLALWTRSTGNAGRQQLRIREQGWHAVERRHLKLVDGYRSAGKGVTAIRATEKTVQEEMSY